jgi:hypothetical protein
MSKEYHSLKSQAIIALMMWKFLPVVVSKGQQKTHHKGGSFEKMIEIKFRY